MTMSVTGTVCGLLLASVEEIITFALYVPAVRVAGFTATVTEPGVVPEAGVAETHVPPLVVTEKFVLGVLAMEMPSEVGVGPPMM